MQGPAGATGATGATGAAGAAGPTYFLGKANRGSSSAGGDSYYFPTSGSNLNQPTVANSAMKVANGCTLSEFQVTSDVTGYVSRTFTVLVGGTPNSMSATGISIVLNGSATSGSSGATASVSAGQFITIKDAASGANAVTVNFYWSLKCQ